MEGGIMSLIIYWLFLILTLFWLSVFLFNLLYFIGILHQEEPPGFPYDWSRFPYIFFIIFLLHIIFLKLISLLF